MLLQSILQLFDQELARLHALRDVVADLATVSPVADLPLTLAALTVEVPVAPVVAVPVVEPPAPKETKRKAGRGLSRASLNRRPVVRKTRAVDHGALTSVIPAGPVVVSADRLQVKKAAAKSAAAKEREAAPKEGTLGSMIRALHLRLPAD